MRENGDQSFTTLKLSARAISNANMYYLSIITVFCVTTAQK